MVFAADYPFLEIFWTMIIFFAWVIWVWMVITVFVDVVRRDDISGWWKAAWSLFILVLPFLGVFIYLISQGRGMAERKAADSGAIDQADFEQLKRKALA